MTSIYLSVGYLVFLFIFVFVASLQLYEGLGPNPGLKFSPASFMVEVAVGGSVAIFTGISTFY